MFSYSKKWVKSKIMDLQKNKYGKFEKNTTFERIFYFFLGPYV